MNDGARGGDWRSHDRLTIALLLAAILHAVLILGVGFEMPKPEKIQQSLDIVLVQSPTERAPEKAEFLAPEHQVGGGEGKEKAAPRSIPEPRRSVAEKAARPSPEQQQTAVEKASARPVLKQQASEKKVDIDRGAEDKAEPETPRLSAEALSRQIAELSSELNKSRVDQALQTRIAYINSVNAHRFKAAAYEAAWQEKVERIGNLNYPDEARRKNLSGSLILAVGIRQDGSIYSIKVRQSSGEPVLDDAAQRIVRLAAPYAAFPEELKREADVLVITRTWRFSVDNRVETGR